MRTRGVVDGDDLVLNGQKVWTTSAQYADWGFIVCRTNPDVPKHDGITFARMAAEIVGPSAATVYWPSKVWAALAKPL